MNTELASISSHCETFILPDIGEGIVECEIVKWVAKEGDHINEDDVVVEVMTDKAVVEIPAKLSGTLAHCCHQEGEIAKVHAPLFSLIPDGAINGDIPTSKSTAPDSNEEHGLSAPQVTTPFNDGSVAAQKTVTGKVAASPAVRRLAREMAIDLQSVKPSGKNGRVLKSDLFATAPSATTPDRQDPNIKTLSSLVPANEPPTPLTALQKVMFKEMTRSASSIPHFSVSDEVVVDELLSLKQALAQQLNAPTVSITLMPLLIKALSLALLEFPLLNARLSEEQDAIIYNKNHNIGIAVDSEHGLVVPNIKHVEQKSLTDIAVDIARLVNDVKSKSINPSDLNGGNITVSNVGMLGGITATPIIKAPELAIVAIGKIRHLPRFNEDNQVTSQAIMHVNWSADHRVIDGATLIRFNNTWLQYLQKPWLMLAQTH